MAARLTIEGDTAWIRTNLWSRIGRYVIVLAVVVTAPLLLYVLPEVRISEIALLPLGLLLPIGGLLFAAPGIANSLVDRPVPIARSGDGFSIAGAVVRREAIRIEAYGRRVVMLLHHQVFWRHRFTTQANAAAFAREVVAFLDGIE